MDWLEERPFSTLWVDGNHENYDLLNKMEVKEWNGGKVHFIRPSVIHLMRGQVFTIAGKTFFTFGGARSHDISDGILEPDDPMLKVKTYRLDAAGALYRINHLSWWQEEMPSDIERKEGIDNLEKAGWKVDYIVSHCCSTDILTARSAGLYESDEQTDYFSWIRNKCSFGHWFFGHYHVNEDWSNKETCLYEQIVELTENGYKACDLPNKLKKHERVRFRTYGLRGEEEFVGTIMSIDAYGGGIYTGTQPTANIRTEDGRYYKNIPLETIRVISDDEEVCD